MTTIPALYGNPPCFNGLPQGNTDDKGIAAGRSLRQFPDSVADRLSVLVFVGFYDILRLYMLWSMLPRRDIII